METIIPSERVVTCDICGRRMNDYLDYDRNIQCILERKREKKRLFNFFRRRVTEWGNDGYLYEYRALDLCGRCYDKMVTWVKNEISKEDNENDNV